MRRCRRQLSPQAVQFRPYLRDLIFSLGRASRVLVRSLDFARESRLHIAPARLRITLARLRCL